MPRLIIGFALLATVALHADTLKDASNWADLVYSAKERGFDYPATVARARHGDISALAILFRHTPHTAPAQILIASCCAIYWRSSAIRNSAAPFGKSEHHSAAKSQRHSILTSLIRGRSTFHSHTRSAPMTLDY
jgi:hypothetical protein